MIDNSLILNLIRIIHYAIQAYIIIIIIRSLMSWMGPVPRNAFFYWLARITDPVFRLVHRHIPFAVINGIDISPIIIIIVLSLLDQGITRLLIRIAYGM